MRCYVLLDALSPEVDKRLCKLFELKNFGVRMAVSFPHTNLGDPLETWHSKNTFSALGLNVSTRVLHFVVVVGPA